MALYGILVFNNTGIPVFNYGYTEEDFPSSSVIDPNTTLVTFSEDTENFDIIYARLFVDPDRLAVNYKLPCDGGIIYNFSTDSFELHKEDWSIQLDEFTNTRNQMLASTDKYMLIPDLPNDIQDELVVYRQKLRDITSKLGNEWNTIHDIDWPEFPKKLLPQRISLEPESESDPVLGIDIPVE